MKKEAYTPSANASYEGPEVTKPPNWHALVSWDMLFNNLATGLFLVAAVGELLYPTTLGPVARLAYPVALVFLVGDLLCLVMDLGDPLRFHHMLRVFKPTSPMSLGTWSLTAFSVPLSVVVGIDVLGWLGWVSGLGGVVGGVRMVLLILGLPPALGSAVYKGVLFSTTAQPGWKEGRWLGAYLTDSAVMLGSAEMLMVAHLMGHEKGVEWLSPLVQVLLLMNLAALGMLVRELGPTMRKVVSPDRLLGDLCLVAVGGFAVPLALAFVRKGWVAWVVGLVCLLGANFVVRHLVVMLPHMARERKAALGRSEAG